MPQLIDHIDAIAGEGMTIYLPRTKTDRSLKGTTFSFTIPKAAVERQEAPEQAGSIVNDPEVDEKE